MKHTRPLLIAIALVSVVMVAAVVFLRNPGPEPDSNNAEIQQSPIDAAPTFDDPPTPPDIVRERAALDDPAQSNANDTEQE